ncbi:hypothetical protein MUK42_33124, partial [Musa troglodytarum]
MRRGRLEGLEAAGQVVVQQRGRCVARSDVATDSELEEDIVLVAGFRPQAAHLWTVDHRNDVLVRSERGESRPNPQFEIDSNSAIASPPSNPS